jgi:hypothetical protein
LERFAREDVAEVLREFGIRRARRADPLDPTEEAFLIDPGEYASIDIDAVTLALKDVFPHTKVIVAPDSPMWVGDEVIEGT